MEEKENYKKLYFVYEHILNNEVDRFLELLQQLELKDDVSKETRLFLESAKTSIDNSIKMIENNNFVDALCLLRSSFEAILFAITISLDKKTYDVYKHYSSDNYRYWLQKKNPNLKIYTTKDKRKDYLSPARIRKIVSQKYNVFLKDFFIDCKDENDVKNELDSVYHYLCDFTHPSLYKAYVFKIENDEVSLYNLKVIFKNNIYYCQLLLLLCMNYFTIRENTEKFLDLYGVIFIISFISVDSVEKMKSLMNKYKEYLYLNINKSYFKNNEKKLKKYEEEIKKLAKEDISKGFGDLMLELIRKFSAEEICAQYFDTIINN